MITRQAFYPGFYPVRIAISPGFCILIFWFAFANGFRALAMVFAAAAVHEIGHFMALNLRGARVTEIRFGISGAIMTTENFKLSYGDELCAVLAGPAANLAAALCLRAAGNINPALTGVNVILCIFNLIPVRTLDGGRALELLISWAFGPDAAESVIRMISMTASAALAFGIGMMIYQTGGSLWLLPAMIGMILSALKEKRIYNR